MLLIDADSALKMGSIPQLVLGPEPPPPANSNSGKRSYSELRGRMFEAAEAGRLEEALLFCDQALQLAEELGDQELVDQTFCNRFGIALSFGDPGAGMGRLREILMRNGSPATAFSAAYNLAGAHMHKKHSKKGLFYARISRDKALAAGNEDWLVKSRSEIGRALLSESYFEEAEAELQQALALLPPETSILHTGIFGNLGYVKLLLGKTREGFHFLYRALRWCLHNPKKSMYESQLHLSLCYGYIELRRWRYAWHHGKCGLALAESSGDHDGIKTALYLLGEVEKSTGDIDAAYHYFSRLGQEFYPDVPDLPETMLCVETKQLVNLRA